MSDKLEEIFLKQSELNDAIFAKQGIRGPDGEVLTMAAIRKALEREELGPNGLPNQWLRNYLTALKAEAVEVEQDLLWKWWSKDRIDIQNIRVEIVDLMHFLTSMALVAGLSPEDFHRLYTKKHEVNQKRQEDGYSKANKNEADNKGVI
ncbi:MAG: dUTP diphosphatase [Planctomycetes bacterium]|nr:dUTP diphosphatase [Planctomycetota bacterium]